MTVMAERTHTHDYTSGATVEEFEAVAEAVAVESDALRLEFIGGRIREKRMPDGDHDEILGWLQRRCMQASPDMWLYGERGLRVEKYRKGRARPDGTLAPEDTFAGQGEWASPDGVLMTVEITSYDADTDKQDREEKPAAYAAAGIPVHLLIDREAGTATVFSAPDPEGSGYREKHTVTFGVQLALPSPVGFVLETDILKNYVR